MSVVLLNESMVHYEVLGRGRPVIFLHGWVGSWRYWISSMQVASTSFRAYAIDLWGFGGTFHNAQHYNLTGQSTLLKDFMNEMGIGKIALVGHGLGALVSLEFAASNPSLVDRVMLTNCPLEQKAISKRLTSESPAELAASMSASLPAGSDAALGEARNADPAAVVSSLQGFSAGAFFNQVNRQYTPCLLVSGGQDELVSPPGINRLSLLSDLGHHIVLEEAGHFPMLDAAAKFNRLLTDFLALDSGVSTKELDLKEEWKRRVR